jgi:hypothetical protein
VDPWHEGWVLGQDSWHFHRRLFERTGLRLAYGEYATILRTIARSLAVRLPARQDVYEVPFRRGRLRVACRGGRLLTVLPGGGGRKRP